MKDCAPPSSSIHKTAFRLFGIVVVAFPCVAASSARRVSLTPRQHHRARSTHQQQPAKFFEKKNKNRSWVFFLFLLLSAFGSFNYKIIGDRWNYFCFRLSFVRCRHLCFGFLFFLFHSGGIILGLFLLIRWKNCKNFSAEWKVTKKRNLKNRRSEEVSGS